MKNIIAIIPARSGSKGIRNKNISDIFGFPMIAYSIYAAKLCDNISRIIVSTDSEEYASIARSYGADVPFLRPAEISGSTSLDIEYLEYTLKELKDREGEMPDLVVLLRPTTPLRNVDLIREAIDRFLSAPSDATSLVSVSAANDCAYKWAKIADDGYLQSPFSELEFDDVNNPRQSFPKLYIPDGYVDVLRSDVIIGEHKVYGDRSIPFLIEEGAVDIDRPEDLAKVRDMDILEKNEIYKELVKTGKKGEQNA